MMNLLRRILDFFQRRTDSNELQPQQPGGSSELKNMEGIVTSFYGDYGWINESIFFKSDAVTGQGPLTVGQKVIAVVEEDEEMRVLKAISVKTTTDPVGGIDPSDLETRVITRRVTTVTQDTVYISRETGFSLRLVSGGFRPYEGDLIHVEYSFHPGTSNIYVHTLSATNSKNMYEVYISSIEGRTGVVEKSIFFTLDSLDLPSGYVPQLYDIVNLVAVESIHYPYCWRAISMKPAEMIL